MSLSADTLLTRQQVLRRRYGWFLDRLRAELGTGATVGGFLWDDGKQFVICVATPDQAYGRWTVERAGKNKFQLAATENREDLADGWIEEFKRTGKSEA